MSEKKILIVEDEMIFAFTLKKYLDIWGYYVTGIETRGEDAIKTAIAVNPSLILMDIKLADDIDGITATQEIQKKLSVPIIFLTASHDTLTLSRIGKIPHHKIFHKPIIFSELKNEIDRIFESL